MKCQTEAGRKVDVRIEAIQFNNAFLRVGRHLVRVACPQLRDTELIAAKIAVETGYELLGDNDGEWWIRLRTEFEEHKREFRPRKKRAAIRAVEPIETEDVDEPEAAA
jgi:hypothetical protein